MSIVDNKTIQKRQNEDSLLSIQYASRVFFNKAEMYNGFAWYASWLSAIITFIPSTSVISLILVTLTIIFICMTKKYVRMAAKLRKYFDSYVLDIQSNLFCESECREIKEQARRICAKDPQKADMQKKNTGRDTPPGVREWYEFSKELVGLDAQFECQLQNTWWNKEMSKHRLLKNFGWTAVVLVIVILMSQHHHTLTLILPAISAILAKLIERTIENCKYLDLSKKIEHWQELLEDNLTIKGIEKFQVLIDKRRSINVLELGNFHKKVANELSRRYEHITS